MVYKHLLAILCLSSSITHAIQTTRNSHLRRAIEQNRTDYAAYLVGTTITSPLHIAAACKDNLGFVTFIVNLGFPANGIDKYGQTPLHYTQSADVMRYLIVDCNVDPNVVSEYGNTPLHEAAANGNLEVAKCLIDEFNANITKRGSDDITALHAAALSGNTELVLYLIQKGISIHITDTYGQTPLFYSSSSKMTQFLINECNANIQHKNTQGNTVLHVASMSGNLPVVQSLTQICKMDPFCLSDNGNTPLHITNTPEVANYFIRTCKMDPLVQNRAGMAPIHLAALNGHLSLLAYYIEMLDINPNLRSTTLETPMHMSAAGGHLQLLVYLLQDAQVSPRFLASDTYHTPWHYANLRKHKDILKMITLWSAQQSKSPEGKIAYCPSCHSTEGPFAIASFYCLHYVCRTCKDVIMKKAENEHLCPVCKNLAHPVTLPE